MAVNKYLNSFPKDPTSEQLLLEELIIESIQMHGADCYYIVRNSLDGYFDSVYGENPIAHFTNAYMMEMYMENFDGPEGQSEYFSKFGLEIRDNYRLTLARKTFKQYGPTINRPREGDLIYVPFLDNLFEIKFVQEEKLYYGLGRRAPYFYYFELQCELFRFSNERFNTGIDEIDSIAKDYSYTITFTVDDGGTGNYFLNEPVYQGSNLTVSTASGVVKEWDIANNKLSLITIKGEFDSNVAIIGANSGASYIANTFNRKSFEDVYESFTDNVEFENEANLILDDGSEDDDENPLGIPN